LVNNARESRVDSTRRHTEYYRMDRHLDPRGLRISYDTMGRSFRSPLRGATPPWLPWLRLGAASLPRLTVGRKLWGEARYVKLTYLYPLLLSHSWHFASSFRLIYFEPAPIYTFNLLSLSPSVQETVFLASSGNPWWSV